MKILDAPLRRVLLSRLERIEQGRLRVTGAGSGDVSFGRTASPAAAIEVKDPRFWRAAALGGSVGAAEAYVGRLWECDDLASLVRILVRNRSVLDGIDGGLSKLRAPFRLFAHALRRNTRAGSRRNVGAHYDLGDDFFSLFLDDTLTYSCAVFERPDATLRDASIAKYESLCRKLALSRGDRVIEIGTGWGGLAIHAAQAYGCSVTTTTISRKQFDFARRRVSDLGLSDRVTVVERDYRDLEGRFDKGVSIEMIEAVGHDFLGAYFAKCASLLDDGGLFALQAITLPDREYDRARREVDFIKKLVFPGSCIPSVTALASAASLSSDLRLVRLDDIGEHYAETLRLWRERLVARRAEAIALGYPDSLVRLFEFYFAYCEGGFAEGVLSDVQMVFERPRGWAP